MRATDSGAGQLREGAGVGGGLISLARLCGTQSLYEIHQTVDGAGLGGGRASIEKVLEPVQIEGYSIRLAWGRTSYRVIANGCAVTCRAVAMRLTVICFGWLALDGASSSQKRHFFK